MVPVDKNEAEAWLQKIRRWDEIRGLEVSQERDNLKSFLEIIHKYLAELDNTTIIIQRLPNIGQLLTQIARRQDLLSQDGMYDVLIRCVLQLMPTNPQTALEKRASQWAQALIRKTTSYYNQQSPGSRVAGQVGYGTSDFHEYAIEQLTKSICLKLEALVRPKDDQEARTLLSEDAADVIRDVSAKVTPLLKVSSCQPVVEMLLHYSSLTFTPSLSECFLDRLLKIQEEQFIIPGNNQTVNLPEKLCVALWSSYLPGLEHAVMCFVQHLSNRPHISHQDAMKLLVSSHLPKACSENPSLYKGVDKTLRQFLISTDGSPVILKAIHVFQCCYEQENVTAVKQNHMANYLVPCSVTSIKAMLQIHPSDLQSAQVTAHLKTLWVHINNLIDEVHLFEVWLLIVKHQYWYHQALLHSFSREASVKDACCSFIAWFQNPNMKDELKCSISDFIKCLSHGKSMPDEEGTWSLPQTLQVQLMMAHTALLAKDGKDISPLSSYIPTNKAIVDEIIFCLDILDVYAKEVGEVGCQAVQNLLRKLVPDFDEGSCLNLSADIRQRLNFHIQPLENG